ncbi:hypothetical protein TURU_084458 [Turdus rufiventris]|nr:hypothetical protein TURU_084458 [Turdus rufiventris]
MWRKGRGECCPHTVANPMGQGQGMGPESAQQEINFWITLSGTSYSLPGLRLCATFLGNSLEWILDNGGYLPKDAGEQASARALIHLPCLEYCKNDGVLQPGENEADWDLIAPYNYLKKAVSSALAQLPALQHRHVIEMVLEMMLE